MTGREIFQRNKALIFFFVKIANLFPFKIRKWLLLECRNTKGKLGVLLRYIFIKTCARRCGENVIVKEMVILENIQNISFGNNVSIHPFCYLEALGGITIGDNVSIAHSSSILSVNHIWDDPNTPIKYNPIKSENVNIEDDVWVGCGCRILAGTTIRRRSVIAAGAVVVKDIETGVLVGGVPAKTIKKL